MDRFSWMLSVSHCDGWILMVVECVSLWQMDFDGSWGCLIMMDRFWRLLSEPHCDGWIFMDVECISFWWMEFELVSLWWMGVGCVSLWCMDFDDCWVSLIMTEGFWWLLSVYYCDRWILMAVECLPVALLFFSFTKDVRIFSWASCCLNLLLFCGWSNLLPIFCLFFYWVAVVLINVYLMMYIHLNIQLHANIICKYGWVYIINLFLLS